MRYIKGASNIFSSFNAVYEDYFYILKQIDWRELAYNFKNIL